MITAHAWNIRVEMEQPIGIRWLIVDVHKLYMAYIRAQVVLPATLKRRYVQYYRICAPLGDIFRSFSFGLPLRSIFKTHLVFTISILQFVTKDGLSEFIYYLEKYDSSSSAFKNYKGGDDDGKGYNNQGFANLPMCEQVNGKYVGLGCNDDGTFALQYFSDAYCLTPTGTAYDSLKQLNKALKTYKSCATISSGGSNDDSALPALLVASSNSCSSLDSSLCIDNSYMKSRRSHSSKTSKSASHSYTLRGKTWLTKLKYATAGMLLLASFIMFTGILFTNRRRRRALMQRKFRQQKSKKPKSSRSSRSKSKTKDGKDSKSSRRSKSRVDDDDEDGGGVLT
jgi:hypothetical protein